MAEPRYERVEASDGAGSFEAYCAVPDSGAGPGNFDAPSCYHRPAADEACDRTLAFLDRHLR